MNNNDKFSVKKGNGYIHLKTWGELASQDLSAPIDAAIKLAEANNIKKLLDDIRDIDTSNINIPLQAKGIGVVWKLQHFDKVAIIFGEEEIGWMLTSSLDAVHIQFSSRIKGFKDEASAIAWLNTDA